MKFDRYSFISLVVLLFFSLVVFFYARLTLVEGAQYREFSDEKRIRTVITTAPRGEILDRNGLLIAGNRASFTVQLQKDILSSLSPEEKNSVSLSLIRLLESDGVDYLNEYPVLLNTLSLKGGGEGNAEDFLVEKLLKNGLVESFLTCDRNYYAFTDYYKFTIGDRLLKAIESKEGEVPLVFKKSEEGFSLQFKEMDIYEWEKNKGIDKIDSPLKLLEHFLVNDPGILRKVISHPIARLCAYELLNSKGLADRLELKKFSLSFDDKFLAQKVYLKTLSPKVTDSSSATDDFCSIFDDNAFGNFMKKIYPPDEKGKAFSVQKEAVRFLSEKGIETNIEVALSKDGTYNLYTYRGGFDPLNEEPSDIILNFIRNNNLVKEFLTQDTIKYRAQGELIELGINPGISISETPFTYTALKDKENFLTQEKLLNDFSRNSDSMHTDSRRQSASIKTVETLFYLLREKHNIPEELSDFEARGLLSLNRLVRSQGFLAYQPINLAYGVSDKTVATIKESFGTRKGVLISVEPVRYYPYNSTASHVIGYIGKISQDSEVEKYIKEKNYQVGDFVGKTGLEQAMEDVLRGTPGKKVIEIDAIGNTTGEIEQSLGIPGHTVVSTIDIELEKFAEEKLSEIMKAMRTSSVYESPWGNYKYEPFKDRNKDLKNPQANTGAVVVQKVKSGEILAMASVPSFNPNLFSEGISQDDFRSLFPENEKDLLAPRPLFNIATQTPTQPGSVFKMVTGLTALEKGWNPNKKILDMGYVEVGTSKPRCWYYAQYGRTHGKMNLKDALENSCNYYFYSLALGENQRTKEKLSTKVDISEIDKMARRLGFGEKTGIEIKIPAEQKGSLPNKDAKRTIATARLNSYLRSNIERYVVDKKIFNKEGAIKEILSWLGEDKQKSRGEVIGALSDLGLEPLVPLDGRKDGLADIIKFTYFIDARWGMANTLNATIGQGEISATPLQISNYISTLANGGRRYKPSVIDSTYDDFGIRVKKNHEYEDTGLSKKDIDEVKEGMEQVINKSHIKSVFESLPFTVAGKTGSAEKSGINPATGEEYSAYAWFTCYAPADDPEVAVTVLIFQGRTGSNAAPLARDILAKYFKSIPPEKESSTVKSSGNQE